MSTGGGDLKVTVQSASASQEFMDGKVKHTHTHTHTHTGGTMTTVVHMQVMLNCLASEREQAKFLFELLDSDKNGRCVRLATLL